jgi:CheY-like chemotaxis protein
MNERPQVYMVDDSDDDHLLLQHALRKSGLAVDVVPFAKIEPAREALMNALRGNQQTPIGVLLDIKLGGESGFDLLRWIRAQPELAHLPVVIASSSTVPGDLEEARKMGASECVEKSSGNAQVLSAVQSLLQRSGRE